MPHVHPLLRAAVLQPHLLFEHVSAYGAVLAEEGALAASAWRRQLAWQLAAGAGIAIGLVLAGVAAMLWAVVPEVPPGRAWVLLAVPLLPWLVAAWALRQASRRAAHAPFLALRRQAGADLNLLRGLPAAAGEP
jgi:hypothetical protein